MKLDKNMVAALLAFGGGKGGGIVPSGALSISANGTYDVGAFASAVVAVPASAVVSGTKSISANGTHDVTAFANAEVLVPASAVCSGTKSISSNGTHDVVGFANVDVNVAGDTSNEDGLVTRTLTSYENSRVASIGSWAFYSNLTLTNVTFPTCETIGSWAFCSNLTLTNVTFPTCETIGSYAFGYCKSLTMVSFPNVTRVDNFAFRETGIINISFPKCTSVGEAAFSSCLSLTNAMIGSCSTLPVCAFYNCTHLLTVSLPALSGTINSSCFYSCYNLSTMIANTSYIWTDAFAHCHNLSMVSFPKVTGIRSSAFRVCYNLLSVYLLGSSVCKISATNVFASTPIAGYTASTGGVYGSIYVPESLYETYISSTNWVTFSSRFVSLTDAQIAALNG